LEPEYYATYNRSLPATAGRLRITQIKNQTHPA
jgi:hypothetical protein